MSIQREAFEKFVQKPFEEQPFLLSPSVLKVAQEAGMVRTEGDRLYVGPHWVMESPRMGEED